MAESSPPSSAAFQAFARGRVQGVGFRDWVERRATRLGLAGYVRNLSDGVTVEVVAEGPKPDLDSLLALLQRGPESSHVERVDIRWIEPSRSGFAGFTTRR